MSEPKAKGKEVKSSIPVYMMGIDNTIDFVPDAETPEKCMELQEKDWTWDTIDG